MLRLSSSVHVRSVAYNSVLTATTTHSQHSLFHRCITYSHTTAASSSSSHSASSSSRSFLNAQKRSRAGIAPIDTEGEITLEDESNETKLKEDRTSSTSSSRTRPQAKPHSRSSKSSLNRTSDALTSRERASSNSSASESAPTTRSSSTTTPPTAAPPSSISSRALHPSDSEDLRAPLKVRLSATHSQPREIERNYDPLMEKPVFRSNPATKVQRERLWGKEANVNAASNESIEPLDVKPDFTAIKRGGAASSVGWASAKSSNQTEGASSSSSTSTTEVWSDQDWVTIFPHLRFAKISKTDDSNVEGADSTPHSATSSSSTSPRPLATSEQLHTQINEYRTKFPELEKLHFVSTFIKVRKWRELLGAGGEDAGVIDPRIPVEYHRNALHTKYLQSDLFFTVDEVSSMLFHHRELLFLRIEDIVIPRLQIIRSHLPDVNLNKILQRNPALLLSDLHTALPMKLRELKMLLPELNVIQLIERDARLLNHAVSSYFIPRLNLFESLTNYTRPQVVQFMCVEHVDILTQQRWNRLKRVEIVKDQRFWAWWNKRQQTQMSGAEKQVDSTNTDEVPLGDPSSLPFSLYAELILMPNPSFSAEFPWYQHKLSGLELELVKEKERKMEERRRKGRNEMDGGDGKNEESSALTSEASISATASLPSHLLARIPGFPQALPSALGTSSDSLLTQDELRAKRRMEYLKLKETKAEQKSRVKSIMREKEADFQRRKMEKYTQKFNSIRDSVGSAAFREERDYGENDRDVRPSSSSSSSFDRRRSSGTPSYSSSSSRDRDNNDGQPHGGGGSGGFHQRGSRPSYERSDGRSGPSSRHMKNRPGEAQVQRHRAHSTGRIE